MFQQNQVVIIDFRDGLPPERHVITKVTPKRAYIFNGHPHKGYFDRVTGEGHGFGGETPMMRLATDAPPANALAAHRLLIQQRDALITACQSLLDAMEMQEGRMNESLHIPAQTAVPIWEEAKAQARAAIAQAKEAA